MRKVFRLHYEEHGIVRNADSVFRTEVRQFGQKLTTAV